MGLPVIEEFTSFARPIALGPVEPGDAQAAFPAAGTSPGISRVPLRHNPRWGRSKFAQSDGLS
jgi:hypothetical protein